MQISGFGVDMVERERVERMFSRNPKRLIDFLFSDSIGNEKRPKFEDKKNKRRRF